RPIQLDRRRVRIPPCHASGLLDGVAPGEELLALEPRQTWPSHAPLLRALGHFAIRRAQSPRETLAGPPATLGDFPHGARLLRLCQRRDDRRGRRNLAALLPCLPPSARMPI